ncbi:8467_t:CDS:2 [Funneliformis geosporum]|uniref:8467_t:CDS:1 n=1 Tax=Funneliformis geosporum TaxID=1117311 RepID=A0A9W4WTK8_9GLOM|nr:8467_t:CDS:2 [Funneliformis geosporum]
MDDITLISNFQENLNSLLKITDSFNHLNKILTNVDKEILITTANPSCIQYFTPSDPNSLTSHKVLLQYNNKIILISFTSNTESVRFLAKLHYESLNISHISTLLILHSSSQNIPIPLLLSKYIKPGIQFDILLHTYNLL